MHFKVPKNYPAENCGDLFSLSGFGLNETELKY